MLKYVQIDQDKKDGKRENRLISPALLKSIFFLKVVPRESTLFYRINLFFLISGFLLSVVQVMLKLSGITLKINKWKVLFF